MSFVKRYLKQIAGVSSCFDRVVINGTLPGFCYAEGMTGYLYAKKIRIVGKFCHKKHEIGELKS
ncbi:MAG: hypothetical protein GY702_02125 [Desulfobulbaceae bacterium]|nr:hypothetical protein [Desulfobulbaceae bacterium]